MKKVLLFAMLLVGSGRLMAQTDMKMPGEKPSPLFYLKTDTTLTSPSVKDWTKLPEANKLKELATLAPFNQAKVDETKLIGPMQGYLTPVAVLQGNSKMPVVKLDGYSKMPVYDKDLNKKNRATIVTP
ncbi:hypothetical protein [Mucilaginibacter pedocola]|uniref:Uncharacterized protein n=1 Tax=Mucilaginibacter pedocola TaxID=1792845 RepID=A0A1S9PCZ1_9SPHI|nr:hypothetical protein [Mucilaginibacter pedocola]OOQ58799.1 hypothetical protein BC343_09125 [Mucilaginibacter pedocola]